MTRGITTTAIGEGTLFVQGPGSNWVVLVGSGEVALIDSGYPADRALVEQSITDAGGDGLELRTIFITHGHSDHIGGAADLARRDGGTVYASAEEVPNVRRDITQQANLIDIAPHLWKPRVLRWAWRAVRAGTLAEVGVPTVRALPAHPVRAAGFTVTPLALPGHSTGHTAYLLPEANVLVTGDALVSAHPTSAYVGPQLLPEMFHADPSLARRSLEALDNVHAAMLLPGHGRVLHMRPSDAVTAAHQRWAAVIERERTAAVDRFFPPPFLH